MAKKKDSIYIRFKRFIKMVLTLLFGNRDYQKVVILGRQRTGSSLLISLLHSHPHVEAFYEAFRLLKGRTSREVWKRTFGRHLPWIRYVGFKIFYYHPEDSEDREVWDLIRSDPTIKIIHIKRKNLLRTYISKLIAQKTGAWNSRQEGSPIDKEDKQVTVDVVHCIAELRDTTRWENIYGKKMFPQHPYMEITYEDLTGNLQTTVDAIMVFLGLKTMRVKSRLKRQNPEKLEDLVSNYDELIKALNASEFEYLVELNTEVAENNPLQMTNS